jgi:hypothetical protein
MAIITIGYRPDLTKEQVQAIFAERFAGEFEIIRSNAINRDFIIKKNNWTGVGLRLKQEKNATTMVFTAMMPNLLLNALFGGLFAYALLRKSWKEMELEIAGFIRLEPQFQSAPSVEKLAA